MCGNSLDLKMENPDIKPIYVGNKTNYLCMEHGYFIAFYCDYLLKNVCVFIDSAQ